jgi:hypothetical protein
MHEPMHEMADQNTKQVLYQFGLKAMVSTYSCGVRHHRPASTKQVSQAAASARTFTSDIETKELFSDGGDFNRNLKTGKQALKLFQFQIIIF